MEPLSLSFIGWFFTLICGAGLIVGCWVILSLHRAGELERRFLGANVLNDTILFGIWILGFAGGIGLLVGKPWSRFVLEFFCWVLIVLVLLSGGTRLYQLKRQSEGPVNWFTALGGVALVAVPILLLCAAAIITLRSPAVQRALSGS